MKASPALASESPYAVLRNRNLALYLTGRFLASLGQQMVTVAVGWELYERTNSAFALGLVGLAQMIPMILFTLPSGHLADRSNRHRILLLMTLLGAAATAGLACISLFSLPVGWIYLCLFLAGCARTFLWPASAALMPELVSRDDFPRAVTWSSGSFHLSSVAGPAAGGLLLAWSHRPSAVYAVNTFLLLACFGLLAGIRYSGRSAPIEKITFGNLAVGFNFVFAHPILLGILTLDLFAVLFGGATALLPVYAKDILLAGPSGLGWLQAALPVGSLACALYMAHRPPLRKAGRALLWAVAGFGVATIGFGLSREFLFSWLALFLCGATDNVSVVVRHTLVQLLTPDEKRGRVSAVNSLFIGTSNELGGFESGLVAQFFGPVFSVVSGGIGTLAVVGVVAVVWPAIRRYGRLGGEKANAALP